MFRDRTNLYLSYRQSYAHHPQFSTSSRGGVAGSGFEVPEEEQFLMSQGDNNTDSAPDAIAIEMDVLPPAWLDISDQIDSVLEEIDEKVTKLGFCTKTHYQDLTTVPTKKSKSNSSPMKSLQICINASL